MNEEPASLTHEFDVLASFIQFKQTHSSMLDYEPVILLKLARVLPLHG